MVYPQTSVMSQAAYGLEGDFCSANPRGSMLSLAPLGGGRLISGSTSVVDPATGLSAPGLIIGRFGRAIVGGAQAGQVVNANPGSAYRVGFIHRNQPGILITQYLGRNVFYMQPGREVTLFDSGDFWARFAAGATIGHKVFASYTDGSAISAPAGTTLAGGSVTGSQGATFTGSIAPTNGANTGTLTVTGTPAGVLSVGDVITQGAAAGTTITALGTGTGGAGTYIVNTSQTVASTSMTAASSVLNVTAVGSGSIFAGEPFTGTNVAPNSAVASNGTGSGGTGTYNVGGAKQTYASTTLTFASAEETRWYVDAPMGTGAIAAGELAMISTRG